MIYDGYYLLIVFFVNIQIFFIVVIVTKNVNIQKYYFRIVRSLAVHSFEIRNKNARVL